MDLGGTDYWDSLKDPDKSLDIPEDKIAISSGLGDVDAALKKNIFFGTSHLELGFMHGLGEKGSRLSSGRGTPEDFGKEERESFRQLAKINDVELSVHVTPQGVPNVSGFDGRKGFSPELKEQLLTEVKSSVDFAADVAQGGAVVVHIGEFPRPLGEIASKGGKKFSSLYNSEEEQKTREYRIVDDRTGDIVASVNDDSPYFQAERDSQGNVKLKEGQIVAKQVTFKEFRETEEFQKKYKFDVAETEKAAKAFVELQLEHSIDNVKGQAAEGEYWYGTEKRQLEEIQKKKENYEKLRDSVPEEDRWKIGKEMEELKQIQETIPFLKKRMESGLRTAEYARGQELNAKERIEHLATITDYGSKQSADNFATMAMYAYDKEKQMGLDRPLFIAPENYLPEQYGGHPEEYKQLIQDSRKQMAERLQKKGMDEDEAKKVAKEHIKGTFDTGHANMWRKYFREDDPDGTKFDKWLVDQVGKMAEDGVIGHVHLTDNFGYHDEHISIGEGNTPIKEMMQKLKEKGYTGKYVAEPGNQPQGQIHKVWTTALGMADSPIYSVDRTTRTWTNIEGSYFGRTQSPNYIVGDNRPSEEWTLWSGVQLE